MNIPLLLLSLSLYTSVITAEILNSKRHLELQGPSKAWNSDTTEFAREAVFPGLRGTEASWSVLGFFQKRQFEDCPSGATIECPGILCCYPTFSTCCSLHCCSTNSTCINDECCPANAKVCPNGKCTYPDGECCAAGHTCGGTTETGTNFNETCCGDSCCYFGKKCCGEVCCYEDELCCGGVCCPASGCVDMGGNGTACEKVMWGVTVNIFLGKTITKSAPQWTSSSLSSSASLGVGESSTQAGTGTGSAASATRTGGSARMRASGKMGAVWMLNLGVVTFCLL
ncbi:hypothetical protein BKA64DRAFT_280024 [Cadophora sp. MPI-SDFR-AT-0126]|nr:hypothetical protein BKA64DRAFT_280024 [Leotiomycetes sp. MPI-SDFR-AT-0126]